jgi:hypothetical protein
MIDYEKLKLAHELLRQWNKEKNSNDEIDIKITDNQIIVSLDLVHNNELYRYHGDIEGVVFKLQKLTQPKPKFKVGQKVYYSHPLLNQFVEDEILVWSRKTCGEIQYGFAHYSMMESDVFEINPEEKKPIYKKNDSVWIIDQYSNRPRRDDVIAIIKDFIINNSYLYALNETDGWHHQNTVYPSREAIIDAQIEYWQSLKSEFMTPKFEDEIKGFNYCNKCKRASV